MKKLLLERTCVKTSESMTWGLMPDHIGLYHKEITSAEEADKLGVALHSVLWEKIEVGGAVLPHYHNCVEIIHITTGTVHLLCNGNWEAYKAGDTFVVPKGVVHSVKNVGAEPSEQISMFLPVQEGIPANEFFNTVKVDIEK